MPSAKIRLTELDGLRGWAALSVVMFHIFWECFGQLFPQIKNPVTAGLLNGHLAVCIFFVVSGAALSAPFFAGGGRSYVMSAAVKRYMRLTLPIVVFTLLFFVLARLGLLVSHSAAPILQRDDWGGLMGNTSPGVTDTVLFMFRDVYLGASGDRNILPFLWTMPVEMLGSMLLFLMMAVMAEMPDPRRAFPWMTVLVFFVSPYLGAFFIGALLSQHRIQGQTWSVFARHNLACTLIILAICFALSSSTRMLHLPGIIHNVIGVLNGALLVYGCMHSTLLKRGLGQTRISAFLGQISFTIYILHYIVLTSVLSWLVLHFQDNLSFPVAMGIATGSLAISILLSWILLPVDKISHRLSGRFAKWVLRPRRSLPEATASHPGQYAPDTGLAGPLDMRG